MDAAASTGLTAAFAAGCAARRAADLDPRDRAQLNLILLDHLACGLRGARLDLGLALRRYAGAATGSAPLYGGGTAEPADAALLNGAAAHGLELDDTHDESVSHPGAAVISAALAVAAEAGAGGGDLLTAVADGYETMGRLGRAADGAALLERGFHPTALLGAFGAAAAAGRVLGLSPDALTSAFGLALSLAGGSAQFSQERGGTEVKRLHGGFAASHGVCAARLARVGVAGPSQAFEGRYGVLALFSADARAQALLEPRPDLEIHAVSFKPYPCCRLFHSTLDALETATEGYAAPLDAIVRIEVGGPALILSQHMLRRPTSLMAAQYQLPFVLATALVNGPCNEAGYGAQARADPRVQALEDRVEAFVDPEYEAAFPRHFGSSVTLVLASGDVRRVRVLDSLGTPARPLGAARLVKKAEGLLAAADAPFTAQTLLSRLERLEEDGGLQSLIRLIASGGAADAGRRRHASPLAARERGGPDD